MKKASRALLICLIALSAAVYPGNISAQCPMCKMSAETNLQNGGSAGKGFNAGIFYMLALPYSIVATLGFIFWKNSRRREEDELEVLP